MSQANDIKKRIDIISGVDVNYRETTTWYDGSPITDEDLDGIIYGKIDGEYYRKTIAEDYYPKVDTINTLRNTNGYYEGQEITLLGYYIPGDKDPLRYKFSTSTYSTDVDDGGYKIKTNRGTWIAEFNGKINALDFGIKTDYNPIAQIGTDNSSTIAKMFAIPSQVYEFPEGDILMNTHLKVPNGVIIRGKGHTKTRIYRGTSIGSSTGVLYQLSSSDAEILEGNIYEHMSFYGGVTTTNHNNFTHLLSVAGVKNAIIRNCAFYGFKADGILISSGPANGNRRRNQNILVENCIFDGVVQNNRNGVSVIMCDHITIQNCHFKNIGAPTLTQSVGAIDVERNDKTNQQTNNVRILNNVFENIDTTNTSGVALFCFGDNTSSGIPSSKNHEIRGNRFINCYWGVSLPEEKLDKSINVTPTGVNISENFFIQNVKAIQCFENSNINITGNHFYGDYANGKYSNIEFWVDNVIKNVNISKNFFYNTGRNASIDITSADGLTISDNFCSSNRPFIQQSVDSVSGGTARVLNSIKIFRNRFESLITSGTALRMYQVASGANNARLIMNNSSCEMYDNEIIGNAVLSNIVTSAFNKQVFDSHITSAMMTGTWKIGDFVEARVANYNYRIRCSIAGTSNFVETIANASVVNGSNIVSVPSVINTVLRKGMFILVGDDTSVKEIIDLYGDTLVLKTNYTGTTNTNATVVASPPQFYSEAISNYTRSTTTNTNLNLGKGEETIIFTGGGTGTSIITTDTNGFPNAIKRYRNNKTGNLTVQANTGITLNGLDNGSIIVEPGKTLTIVSTAANTWVTLEYLNTATSTLIGGVKQSTAVTDVTAVSSTQVSIADSTQVSITDLSTMTTADTVVTSLSDAGATYDAAAQALINDLKAKYNIMVAFVNELKAKANLNVTLTNDEKAKINSNVTLVNDIKSKYNVASTLSNSNKTQLNTKLSADRTSGQQAP